MLVLIFGLPTIAPLFAQGEDAALPACCRRNGAHHCMGTMRTETGVTLRPSKCAAYPAATMQAWHGDAGLVVGALPLSTAVSPSGVKAQAMARARLAREKARGMRGPPASLKA